MAVFQQLSVRFPLLFACWQAKDDHVMPPRMDLNQIIRWQFNSALISTSIEISFETTLQ